MSLYQRSAPRHIDYNGTLPGLYAHKYICVFNVFILRFVLGGQEGDEGFEFLWFAESDLDFAAAS